MFIKRIFTASILSLVIVLSLFKASKDIFFILMWGISAIAIWEVGAIYLVGYINRSRYTFIIQVVMQILIAALCYLVYHYEVILLNTIYVYKMQFLLIHSLIWFFIVPYCLLVRPKIDNIFTHFTLLLLIVFLVIICFVSLIAIYDLTNAIHLLLVIAISSVADTSAYLIGKKFGRHKLLTEISKNKTIEGALGAFLGVAIYLLILHYCNVLVYITNQYSDLLRYAFILAAVSIIGDLFESWIKRVANVKDSGKILPGHGGVLDRIDSMLAVIPTYLLILIL